MADPSDELTVEQLTATTGIAYTTVRLYQQRGLLPPPTKRGRVGYYGPGHVARIRLIAQLQERGYSLAAIKDLVDTWEGGRTLPELLGLESQVTSTFDSEPTLLLTAEELMSHFGDVELTAAAMQRAAQLDLVAFEGDRIAVLSPAFLEVGSTLARMGIGVDEILDEYEHLRIATSELAQRFTALFERNLWAPFAARNLPADEVGELTTALQQLGPSAERIVVATLRRALAAEAAGFLDRQADQLGDPESVA